MSLIERFNLEWILAKSLIRWRMPICGHISPYRWLEWMASLYIIKVFSLRCEFYRVSYTSLSTLNICLISSLWIYTFNLFINADCVVLASELCRLSVLLRGYLVMICQCRVHFLPFLPIKMWTIQLHSYYLLIIFILGSTASTSEYDVI